MYFRAGTPLRGFFKSARLSLNDASAEIRHMNDAREKNMKERMQEMMKKRKARFEELDKSGSELLIAFELVSWRGRGRGQGAATTVVLLSSCLTVFLSLPP